MGVKDPSTSGALTFQQLSKAVKILDKFDTQAKYFRPEQIPAWYRNLMTNEVIINN
uniref:Uncharacterized protein n=1 Tax=uncultured marine virus TaxID=186617 RepID=A0A0F7L457_9VIRU|nr:hypothetical protein [uncultured marine virus]